MDWTEIQGRLDAFANDPRQAMNRQPTKYDAAGRVIPDPFTAFTAEEIKTREFVVDKDAVRKTFHMRVGGAIVALEEVRSGRAPIADIDRPETLVDRLQHTRLESMEEANLREATLAESPWSDDYWALYTGALGKRYADPSFPNSADWAKNHKYIQDNPAQAVVAAGNRRKIDQLSPAVFDTNPGTWHMSAVNQIGVSKRSFIIDATFDYEVWNQPMFAYSYEYFNPQTMKRVDSLAQARVPRAQFTSDRFKRYRGASYASIVGVAMRTRYVVETSPSHATTDAPSRDRINAVDYIYDLELDAGGKIVGGEWYQNTHPDFLWTPPPGARISTPASPHVLRHYAAFRTMPSDPRFVSDSGRHCA